MAYPFESTHFDGNQGPTDTEATQVRNAGINSSEKIVNKDGVEFEAHETGGEGPIVYTQVEDGKGNVKKILD